MSYTPEVTDALTEVVNIGVGRAAASLNELIGERIELNVPRVTLCALSEIEGNEQDYCGVRRQLSFPFNDN